MKYAGVPMGMWTLFAGSFTRQLTVCFGLTAQDAHAVRTAAKPRCARSSRSCRSLSPRIGSK